jgi:mRNA interferase RelE/StbE
MSYDLEFHDSAWKEWKKLDQGIRNQFKAHLQRRLLNPHVASARLHGFGMANTYKIKLRDAGYRLVYEVIDNRLVVIVLAVAKRERNLVYELATSRKRKS